jgi:hypothetical protein
MSSYDWLVVAGLLGVIALLFIIDELCHHRARRLERADQAAEHRRLMREVRRQP